jgi:hypothetical protein
MASIVSVLVLFRYDVDFLEACETRCCNSEDLRLERCGLSGDIETKGRVEGAVDITSFQIRRTCRFLQYSRKSLRC